jgi:predicted dehydrogenase
MGKEQTANRVIKAAVIGVGNIGSVHAAQIYRGNIAGMRLGALCDIDPRRRAALRMEYPDVPLYAGAEELLAEKSIDAVIIATPHPFHAPIAIAAFAAGKHVLSEKPAAVEVAEAMSVVDAAERSGKVYGVMFNQRTDPLFAKARELIRGGELGALKRTSWTVTNWYRTQAYYDSGGWRATWNGEGGGVLLNQAPHNLDLWTWLAGMPLAVRAVCSEGKYHRIGVEDEATIYAEFPGGATGVFITSTGEAPGTNRLELVFDRGRLLLENGRLNVLRLGVSEREFCFTSKAGYALPDITEENIVLRPERDGHSLILEDFARTILSGTPLLSPGRDGVNELSISNAAYLSSWTGRRVELPLSPASMAEFHKLLTAKRSAEQSGAAGTRGEAANTSDIGGSEYNARWTTRW